MKTQTNKPQKTHCKTKKQTINKNKKERHKKKLLRRDTKAGTATSSPKR